MSSQRPYVGFGNLKEIERKVREREEAAEALSLSSTVPVSDTASESSTLPQSDTVTVPVSNTPPSQKSTVSLSSTLPLGDTVEIASNYTKIPNAVLDDALSSLTPAEQVVYLRLIRLSYGYKRRTCTVGYDALASRCNISRSGVRLALKTLEGRGLVARVGVDNQAPTLQKRGTVYHVILPEGAVLQSDRVPVSSRVPDSGRVSVRGTMKEISKEKKEKEAPPAPGYQPSAEEGEPKWIARRCATLAFEHHRGDALFTRSRLREAVALAVGSQGLTVSGEDLEWAISPFNLPA